MGMQAVSQYDFEIIRDVVALDGVEHSFQYLVEKITHIFGEAINPNHYAVLGYLIGVSQTPVFQSDN